MPNTDLFELIHSMSRKEKSYFLKQSKANRKNETPQYVKLFEEIEKRETYVEKALIEDLLREKIIEKRQLFSQAKIDLYDRLMWSLRNYHSEKNKRIKLQEYRTNISILAEKGLWKQAYAMIKDAKRIAGNGAFKLYNLEFTLLERRMVRQMVDEAHKLLPNLQGDCERLLYELQQDLSLLKEFENVFLIARNEEERKKEIRNLLERIEEIIGTDQEAYIAHASFDSKSVLYSLLGLYHRLNNDYSQSKAVQQKLLDLFEEDKAVLREAEYQERYLNALNNYFNICYMSNKLDGEYDTILRKINDIPEDSYSLKVQKFSIGNYFSILYFFRKKQYEEVLKIAPTIHKGLKTYGEDILLNRRQTFLFNIAVAHFMQLDYEPAVSILKKITDDRRFETKQDTQLRAKVLHILILFDCGEYDVVEAMIRAISPQINQTDKHHTTPVHIVNAIKKAIKLTKAEQRSVLRELHEQLQNDKEYETIYDWIGSYLKR